MVTHKVAMKSPNSSDPLPAPPALGTPAHPTNPLDILDRVDELRAQVSHLNSVLEHHERLATLGTIAALIAHEFNNVLTPITSYAQMAIARPDDRELTTKALKKAVDGTERAAAIAAAILGFVRDESSCTEGRAARFDVARGTLRCNIARAAEDALGCLARDPEQDGIELVIQIDPHIEVAAKPVAIQHVLLNLILNARSAMLPGGGRLTIVARCSAKCPTVEAGAVSSFDALQSTLPGEHVPRGTSESGWITIEVIDNGRGMNTEQIANVFRPFFTRGLREGDVGELDADRRITDASAADDRRKGGERRGTGLGMTICKRLLADVGGFMWVKSVEGQGTTAGVVVPAV